jgi:5-hydroxyisourate hydrolase
LSTLSTHVLDVALGVPAAQLRVRLDCLEPDGAARELASASTDRDGRVRDWLASGVVASGGSAPMALAPGTYRLTFETGAYFAASGRTGFYPRVEVTFEVRAESEHYHVPLLLSPYGYTTYRGS